MDTAFATTICGGAALTRFFTGGLTPALAFAAFACAGGFFAKAAMLFEPALALLGIATMAADGRCVGTSGDVGEREPCLHAL